MYVNPRKFSCTELVNGLPLMGCAGGLCALIAMPMLVGFERLPPGPTYECRPGCCGM